MAGYLADTWNTYIAGPWKEPGLVRKAFGPLAAGANLFVRGFDEALRAMSGQEYQSPEGIMGNTRRDIGNLLGNLLPNTFHPLRAASNAWSVLSGDVPADILDIIGQFRHSHRQQLSLEGAHR